LKYCANGKECIIKSWFCNGIRECADGSDEANCGMMTKLLRKINETSQSIITSTPLYTSVILQELLDNLKTERSSEKKITESDVEPNKIEIVNQINFEQKETSDYENNTKYETENDDTHSINRRKSSDMIEDSNNKPEISIISDTELVEDLVNVTVKPTEKITTEATNLLEGTIQASTFSINHLSSVESNKTNDKYFTENLIDPSIQTDKTDSNEDKVTLSVNENFSTETIEPIALDATKYDIIKMNKQNLMHMNSSMQSNKTDSNEEQETFSIKRLEKVTEEAIYHVATFTIKDHKIEENKESLTEKNEILVDSLTSEKATESFTEFTDKDSLILISSIDANNQMAEMKSETSLKQESIDIFSSTDKTVISTSEHDKLHEIITKIEPTTSNTFEIETLEPLQYTKSITNKQDINTSFGNRTQEEIKAKIQELNLETSNNITQKKSNSTKTKLTSNAKTDIQITNIYLIIFANFLLTIKQLF
jgi:hypothetical protein